MGSPSGEWSLAGSRATLAPAPSTRAPGVAEHHRGNQRAQSPPAPAPTNEPVSWHAPVMIAEVMATLEPGPGRILLDATVGDGGHAAVWLERGGTVVGIDRDQTALARAARRCERWGDRLHLIHGRFSQLPHLIPPRLSPDAVLMDLGTSYAQVETPTRGFSYTHDGPLDMRMDQAIGSSAAALLEGASVDELACWLHEYGDVPHPRHVARAILRAGPPTTTGALARVIERQFPSRLAMKVLSCVFQALRIAVNDERAELADGLAAAVGALGPGGRGAVLTYHSGEERTVRSFLRRESGQCTCPPALPVCTCQPRARVRVTVRGQRPESTEVRQNPRARSARLWAWERLDAR